MSLYHFTDPINFESIKKYGLLSWEQLLKRSIPYVQCSNQLSRDLDQSRGLQDYIRLCLRMNHPMMWPAFYRSKSGINWLEVDDIVLAWPDTLFSSENAASSRAIINNIRDTAFDSKSNQSEVLVKTHIPVQYIKFPK